MTKLIGTGIDLEYQDGKLSGFIDVNMFCSPISDTDYEIILNAAKILSRIGEFGLGEELREEIEN